MASAHENEFCATCGHEWCGHTHPGMVPEGSPLPCHWEDDCDDFVPSGTFRERDTAGFWPNFWESEGHFETPAAEVRAA